MINLLLLSNFYPVRRESDELLCTVLVTRYGPRTSCQRKGFNLFSRTSRIFSPKIATFPQFYVYLNVTQAGQITSLLLLNHFCPVISYRHEFNRKRKRRIIVYGHSLWSAISLPAQLVDNSFLVSHFGSSHWRLIFAKCFYWEVASVCLFSDTRFLRVLFPW